MKHIPQISEAEYEVMKVIWKYAPISTNDITDKLLQTTSWNPRTIQTLIKRLSDKSAISYEKKGRMFVYSPVISQEEYRKHESSSFLKKFFNGHISDMVSAFVDSDELSADDIKGTQDILNGKAPGEIRLDSIFHTFFYKQYIHKFISAATDICSIHIQKTANM